MTQRIKTGVEDEQEHASSSQSQSRGHGHGNLPIHAQHEGESPAIQAQESATSPPGLNTSQPTSASSTSSPLPSTSSSTSKSQPQQTRYDTRGGQDVYSPDRYRKVSTYWIGYYAILCDLLDRIDRSIRSLFVFVCLDATVLFGCVSCAATTTTTPPPWKLGLLP
jgi:hypothetical protein